jgi:hypothetical protein
LSDNVEKRFETYIYIYIYIYGNLIHKVSYQIIELFRPLKRAITLVNKDFVPLGKMSVSDVFFGTEFKYISRNSLLPTPFAE